uniref:MD-2-related lipid-recognition domain-containing protein n=1 Tax=Panagrolaimus sp. PS1159 TaxID=55785 RepID=A0AC35F1R7_9BILA
MFKLCIVVLALAVGYGFAVPIKHVEDSCTYPNGTDVKIHTYNCDGSWPLMVKDSQVYDSDGNVMYPIDPRKAMILDLISVNNGVAYTDNKVNVKIFSYGKNWLSGNCEWSKLETFGLLDNIDGCDFAHNCPLQTGDLDLKLPLDLSSFAAIVNTLASNKPYQLEVRMYDYNQGSGHEEIACVVAQIRFSEGN